MRLSLRSLPLSFRGALFNIKLVQFSLDLDEAKKYLPDAFTPLCRRGRAIVSLANVQLDRMRLTWMAKPLGFNYRHVAMRFLVEGYPFDPRAPRPGIFFVKSFTDRPILARAADWLTHYRVRVARIEAMPTSLLLEHAGQQISYRLAAGAEPELHGPAFASWAEAIEVVKPLDHAYGINPQGHVVLTRVLRPGWPIEPIEVAEFSTTFFQTARLECGFQVRDPVPYVWQSPVRMAG